MMPGVEGVCLRAGRWKPNGTAVATLNYGILQVKNDQKAFGSSI